MPRETLSRQVRHIQEEVLLLGSMVEQAMLQAVDVLRRRDRVEAHRLYNDDRLINEKRYAIENAILILIATQQPMAHDLRILAADLEVSTELERMGDYAKGIAKVTMLLGDAEVFMPMDEIDRMASLVTDMLRRALDAFIDENPSVAVRIPREDDAVDALYNKIYRMVVNEMINKPDTIDSANLFMWVAHNLERMGDRVTNICERTVFIATGELMEMDTSDDEDSE